MPAANLTINILADVKKAVAGIDEVDKKLSGFATGAAKIGGVIAGAFAVGQVVDFAKEAVKAADESAKVARTTEAIIKATGSAAGVTAKQVGDMATSISMASGVDDELVQAGANILLTFKNVTKAGEGVDDIFTRANQSAVDLAAAGFGSIEANAKTMGKALQDPVKGMTALTRQGVTFTDQQKKQVAAMVAANDTLGAQKLILAEVESQVGGTAAAQASSIDKISVAWGNVQEKVGAALLPLIDELLPVLTGLIDGLLPVVMPVVEVIAVLAQTIIGALTPVLKILTPLIAELAKTLGQQLQRVLTQIAPQLPALAKALGNILIAITPLLPTLADLLLAFAPLIAPLAQIILSLSTLVPLLTGPVNLALKVGLVIPMQIAAGAVSLLLGVIAKLIGWLTELIKKLSNPILKTAGKIISGIGSLNPFAMGVPAMAGVGAYALTGTQGGASARGVTSQSATTGMTIFAGWGADPLTIGPQLVGALNRYTRRNGTTWRAQRAADEAAPVVVVTPATMARWVWAGTDASFAPGLGGMALQTLTGQSRRLALSSTDADGFTRNLSLVNIGDTLTITDDPATPPVTMFSRFTVMTAPAAQSGGWWLIDLERTTVGPALAPPVGTTMRVYATLETPPAPPFVMPPGKLLYASGEAVATGAPTLTTGNQDIPGTITNVTCAVGDVLMVDGYVDSVQSAVANPYTTIVVLDVNGVNLADQIVCRHPSGRVTMGRRWLIPITTAGNVRFLLRAAYVVAGGTAVGALNGGPHTKTVWELFR